MSLCLTLSGIDVFFIRVVSLLIVVTLVAANNNCDPLGAPLWPPLIAFGAPLHAFAGSLGWCPLVASRGRLCLTLDKNGLDCLLTIGVSSDNVKQLPCNLWLITTEFMH
jgi:hypothetical protein